MNKPQDTRSKVSPSDHFFNKFLNPESVVIIGASSKPDNLGGRILDSLWANNYFGRLLTVHPGGNSFDSVPNVNSVEDIKGNWDVAIAAVSASQVPSLIAPLSEKGIFNLIVVSGGFAESGEEGVRIQEELKKEARHYGVRIIGPNGLGVFCSRSRFNSLFLSPEEILMPGPGPVALISQSGAFLSIVLNRLAESGTGISSAVNFGNRVDVDECDLLEWYAEDPEVTVIGIYLESVANGPRFMHVARSVSRKKPILILKGGHYERGLQAAQSHTAALAGSYDVFKAACTQCGILQANNLNQFIQGLETLTRQPAASGNRVLIASNGGGMGVHLTDLCESQGLDVPPPNTELQVKLSKLLPPYYSLNNPLDITGSGTNEQFVNVIETLSKTDQYDLLLLVPLPGTGGITPELAEMLHPALPKEKPVLVVAYGSSFFQMFKLNSDLGNYSVFASPEEAVDAAKLLVSWGTQNISLKPDPISEPPIQRQEIPLNEWDLKNFFSAAGFDIPDRIRLKSSEDAVRAGESLGYPQVMKKTFPNILHKKSEGNVFLNITTESELLDAYKNLALTPEGILFTEKQILSGLDLFLGAIRDSIFGPVLVLGLGGDYTEAIHDTAHLILPAGEREFRSLINKTKIGSLLDQHFDEFPATRSQFMKLVTFMSGIISEHSELNSIELNPVRVQKNHVWILDAKAVSHPNHSG